MVSFKKINFPKISEQAPLNHQETAQIAHTNPGSPFSTRSVELYRQEEEEEEEESFPNPSQLEICMSKFSDMWKVPGKVQLALQDSITYV